MEINNLRQKYLYVCPLSNLSALIIFRQIGQVWLLNCFEGCQHVLAKKKIKFTQIKKIIITHSSIGCINGLIGLLSTVSLNTEIGQIDIYGPQQLSKYIFWGRKYSETHFRYKIYFYSIVDNLLTQQFHLSLHARINADTCSYIYYFLVNSEQPAAFNSGNASNYAIPLGPLCGLLKIGQGFILPDGFIIYSKNFIHGYYLGSKIVVIDNSSRRFAADMVSRATYAVHY